MLLAAVLLGSARVLAQSEIQKGDVNEDGVVNEADIDEIIEIMKVAVDSVETRTYYWYVGHDNPMEMTEVEPIVDDFSSPGWRIIGKTLPNYSMENILWEGDKYSIVVGTSRQTIFVALPSPTLRMRDSEGGELTWNNKGVKVLNGVSYTIYESIYLSKVFNNVIY